MRFVKRFGLLGLALEEDNFLTLPEVKADMSLSAFAATGREGEKYAGVFSPEYSERAAQHIRLAGLDSRAVQPRPDSAQRAHVLRALCAAHAPDHA